jgi:hypothetical protein
MRINLDHNNYSGSSNRQDLRKFTKADFIFIQSAIILFMISIGYLIQNNFMVDLDSKLEKEMKNTILNNRTLSQEINFTNFKQCKYILDYFRLNNFTKNLKNYERHKDVTRILAYSQISISIILFTTILILIKTTSILYLNIFKKASILLCLIFLIIEFLTIVFYLSIYLKSFNMYTYISHILENKCFSKEIFNNFDEKIIYRLFVNSFIPETKFVYICAIILIVIHFANWLILLYKIKLLLIANMNNSSLNSTLISKFSQQSESEIKAYDDLFNYSHQEKYPFYELNIYNKL